jgi:DNA-binding transcriptional LysR family regulator
MVAVMELDLTLVSAFVVLAEEQHFGRAATRLHLTTSALSKRVQRLERQLGVLLVVRDPVEGIRLTPGGSRFLDAAEGILRQAREAALTARADQSATTVRLGFVAGTMDSFRRVDLPGAARELRRECPGARLVPVPVCFSDLDRVVLDDRVDLLLNAGPMCRPGLVSQPLPLVDDRVAIVAARHPLAEAGSVSAEELCEHPILYGLNTPADWMAQFWLADVRPRREARLIGIQEDHRQPLLRRVAASSGALVGLASGRDQVPRSLRALTITGAAPVRMHAVFRHGDRRAVLAVVLGALQRRPAHC